MENNNIQLNIIEKPSECYDDVAIKPQWIILHCIGFPQEKALSILTKATPNLRVSAHYFVPQLEVSKLAHYHNAALEYPIYHLVPDKKRARHAGVGQWGEVSNFNDHAIGIEFHCPNYAYALEQDEENLNWYHFEKYPSDQIAAGILLLKDLVTRYQINPANIILHSDIAPWRCIDGKIQLAKTDPGAYFPMEILAFDGLGLWPKFQRTRTSPLDVTVENAQRLLREVGYQIDITGVYDQKTVITFKAFKLHFMPEAYFADKVECDVTEKMIIGLENLVDKQYKYQLQTLTKQDATETIKIKY